DDHQRGFITIAEYRRRAHSSVRDEHAATRDSRLNVARGDLSPLPAMAPLHERTDATQNGPRLCRRRPCGWRPRRGRGFVARQRRDPREPERPGGAMDRSVVRRRRKAQHAESPLARVVDAVRNERRGDPLAPPAWRDTSAFEPGFGRRYDRELSHPDHASSRFGYEERTRPMGNPCV